MAEHQGNHPVRRLNAVRYYGSLAQAAQAALAASGRVVVPKEPTEAMFFAGNRAANPPIPNVRLIYRAMIEEPTMQVSDEAREAWRDIVNALHIGLPGYDHFQSAIDAAEKRGRAKALREAAKVVDRFERPRMDADDYTFIREAGAAILKLENEDG
jgi:hypothetical protein